MRAYELITEAKAVDNHRVAVSFEGGRRGVFDCRPYFEMGYYKPLCNPALFKCVTVSHGWLNWPGDIDIGADDVWNESTPAPKTTRKRKAASANRRGRDMSDDGERQLQGGAVKLPPPPPPPPPRQ